MKLINTILTFGFILTLVIHANTFHIVKDGLIASSSLKKTKSWRSEDGYAVGSGVGQTLEFTTPIDSKQFTIEGTITIEKTKGTASGIFLGGEYFGFDNRSGYCFLEGGRFKSESLKNTKGLIKPNKPFKLRIVSKNETITFFIDDNQVAKKKYPASILATIALRPHRNTVKVKNLSITGKIATLKKLNHIFTCGKEGYKSYRIPALVTTTKGTLLAFCEGRKNHSHDHGDIDLVLKRSTDNGKTWSELQIVFDNHKHVAGNPVPIVDQKTGRIHLLSCTSDHHEYSIYQGKGRRGIHIQHSDDDGKTWSKPRDISANIYPKNWRWYATGPCSGIQIQHGKHTGRLVAPANHTIVEEEGTDKNVFRAHSIYSDDNGLTWHLGDSSAPGGNESSVAEAGKDLLYHSIRMQSHRQGARGIRTSANGGKTWTKLKHDSNLPCPKCQGAVIRDYSKPNRLIHSNPGTKKGRTGMTIRISEDGGKTWPYSKLVLPSSSAYSDLTSMKNGSVGILYEGGHRDYTKEGIIFQSFTKQELLTEPKRESITPSAKNGWGLWKERHTKFNAQAKQGDIDLLLLGDSITHYWQNNKMNKTDGQEVWNKYFKDKKVANFGIGSDRTQHLLYRLENGNLSGIKPKHVVLMIGTNNVTSGHSPYDIYLGIKEIINTIHKHSPDSTILLYDIFPRNHGGLTAWNHCEQVNQLIKHLHNNKNILHCSINKQLLNSEGKPNKNIFFDGIHINSTGYEIWAKDILKHVSADRT